MSPSREPPFPEPARQRSLAVSRRAKTNPDPPSRRPIRRCNRLDGRHWLRNSISVWSDIRKSPDEARLKHPALFPVQLVERLLETFLPPEGQLVLDPFAGSGSTLVGAARTGASAVGLELSPEFLKLAQQRLSDLTAGAAVELHQASAFDLSKYVVSGTVDLCITSPPYWDILNQRRTADSKAVRHYGNLKDDLGTISDYNQFLTALTDVFAGVFAVLRPGAYCCIVVMDLRKKNRFYPFHSDLAGRLTDVGFVYDDLIIWNRQTEYNNLRPLGYPSVFRVNKVHEFILVLQKPRTAA